MVPVEGTDAAREDIGIRPKRTHGWILRVVVDIQFHAVGEGSEVDGAVGLVCGAGHNLHGFMRGERAVDIHGIEWGNFVRVHHADVSLFVVDV